MQLRFNSNLFKKVAKTFGIFIAVILFIAWIFLYQPKILPFLKVDRLQQFARDFGPKKPSTEPDSTNCKFAGDIHLDFPTRLIMSYRHMDLDYKRAVLLVVLKIYRCQLEGGVGLGWPIDDSFSDFFHPLTLAFHRTIEGAGGDYGSSAYALDWIGENLSRAELGELSEEIFGICKYLRDNYEPHYYRADCKKLFPEI